MSIQFNHPIKAVTFSLILGLYAASCSTFPKSSREDQWSYFEEWDTNRNVGLDSQEFLKGYIEQDYFKTWAGKKNEIGNDELIGRLENANQELKIALTASPRDTVASARLESNGSSREQGGSISEFVHKADRDANKSISQQEWAASMFYVADENSDGVITPIEFYLWQLLRT